MMKGIMVVGLDHGNFAIELVSRLRDVKNSATVSWIGRMKIVLVVRHLIQVIGLEIPIVAEVEVEVEVEVDIKWLGMLTTVS
jgi:hypothetical protein